MSESHAQFTLVILLVIAGNTAPDEFWKHFWYWNAGGRGLAAVITMIIELTTDKKP